jgi:hypothetical protein
MRGPVLGVVHGFAIIVVYLSDLSFSTSYVILYTLRESCLYFEGVRNKRTTNNC